MPDLRLTWRSYLRFRRLTGAVSPGVRGVVFMVLVFALGLVEDNAELHQNVEFTFVLVAQRAKRIRQPARRLVAVSSG